MKHQKAFLLDLKCVMLHCYRMGYKMELEFLQDLELENLYFYIKIITPVAVIKDKV